MTSTAKKHRDLDQTPLSRSNAHGVYLKIGSFDPTFIHRTIKQESVNLNKLETRPANKFSIHGFLTHSQKSVLRLIVSLIVSGATFQARKVTLSKYFSFLSSLWVVALSFW